MKFSKKRRFAIENHKETKRRKGFFGFLFAPPVVPIDYSKMQTGKLSSNLKKSLSMTVRHLLKKHKQVKIGKTGIPEGRAGKDDYAGIYDTMYVLFCSKSRDIVDDLEIYLIRNFLKETENISQHKGGHMKSPDGLYFVYIVVA